MHIVTTPRHYHPISPPPPAPSPTPPSTFTFIHHIFFINHRSFHIYQREKSEAYIPFINNAILTSKGFCVRCSYNDHAAPWRRAFQRKKQPKMEFSPAVNSKDDVGALAAHVDYISSVNNPYIKHAVKLRQSSSYRRTVGSVVVVGSTPLREICEAASSKEKGYNQVEVLFTLRDAAFSPMLVQCSNHIVHVNTAVLQKLAGVDSVDAVDCVGVLKIPSSTINLSPQCLSGHRVLVLDGIQDPGNLGTLLRTAAAFAWDGVFLLPGCCDPFNDKALRAARGAAFRIPIMSGTWDEFQGFSEIHHLKLYAADPEQSDHLVNSSCAVSVTGQESLVGVSVHRVKNMSLDLKQADAGKVNFEEKHGESIALVLGSEGQGLSEEARKHCEHLTIPMPGDFESLNVAVAGGILLFMFRKL